MFDKKLHLTIYFVLIVFHLPFHNLTAQNVAELLSDSLANAKTNDQRIEFYHKIAKEYLNEDNRKAILYIDKANELAKKTNDPGQIAHSYFETGNFYYDKDALDISLEYYLKAYQYYKSQPNSIDKFNVENVLAINYARLKDVDKAHFHFRKAYVVVTDEHLKNPLGQIKALNNLGIALRERAIDSSFAMYHRALKIANEIKSNEAKMFINTNLAINFALQQKLDSSLAYYYKGVRLIEEDSTISKRAKRWVYKATAQFFGEYKQPDSTIYYAKKAKATISNKYSFDNQEIVQLLYKSYLEKEEYEKAAKYFELFEEVSDSLKIGEKLANFERISLEQDYQMQKKTRELEENKRRFRFFLIGFGLVVLLLIASLLLIYYRNKFRESRLKIDLMKVKGEQLSQSIELKNKELIGRAMTEIHRNEMTKDIMEDLKGIKRKSIKKETQIAIDEVFEKLKKSRDAKSIWKEFRRSFEEVYSSFFKQLEAAHPDLSPKEKRLCALLKLNLSTNEMADLSGLSPKSIENARTRLRKKLGLTGSKVELNSYLNQFS